MEPCLARRSGQPDDVEWRAENGFRLG